MIDVKSVPAAISANRYARRYTGSLVPILEKEKEALESLLNNEKLSVRRWVADEIERTEQEIASEKQRDAEETFRP
ncbi:hypothetical protein [Pseudovibrio sp. Ad46]|uniref:hypothetical protein n=1 Tax=Pseudovibrio sp. Ad46 TaxID=989432 RepID=UPI0012903DCF|nr:hypothetical protein [Pseudovibrio sp. Ad46]